MRTHSKTKAEQIDAAIDYAEEREAFGRYEDAERAGTLRHEAGKVAERFGFSVAALTKDRTLRGRNGKRRKKSTAEEIKAWKKTPCSTAEKAARADIEAIVPRVEKILEDMPAIPAEDMQGFDDVEPPPPLWGEETERGILQMAQEDAARADNAGRVVPFVPIYEAWRKLSGVTHEASTWPKLVTCVRAFAMRPEDIRKVAGRRNMVVGGRKVHPRGLHKLAQEFVATLEHLRPAWAEKESREEWRLLALELAAKCVKIQENF